MALAPYDGQESLCRIRYIPRVRLDRKTTRPPAHRQKGPALQRIFRTLVTAALLALAIIALAAPAQAVGHIGGGVGVGLGALVGLVSALGVRL
ncbi:hypothetical protein V2J85_05690 [Streptomyces sp. DSM 41528]|uniref:Uncharacterized protein n=1 Tax=Streptomyces bugieae TaxID=3098223 RepID=A0ABU7NJ04_9ACTN|nr:hypothetical protein [Streptomyces sp. DSM 41528]